MNETQVGPGVHRPRHAECDVPDAEGVRMITAGIASAVLPEEEAEVDPAVWSLGIGPRDYLRRFPNGPNAPLARKVLGVAGAEQR